MPSHSSSLVLLVAAFGYSEAFLQVAPPPLQHNGGTITQQSHAPNPLDVAPRFFFSDYYKTPEPVKRQPLPHQAPPKTDLKVEEFLDRSAKLASTAWNSATRLAEGALWFATDHASPAAPFKEAAVEFIAEHAEKAHQHLMTHGEQSRQVLLETTAHVSRDLMARGKAMLQQQKLMALPSAFAATNQETQHATALMEKIQSSDSKMVIDADILEIQKVAQEIKAEVDAQVAETKLNAQHIVRTKNLKRNMASRKRAAKSGPHKSIRAPTSLRQAQKSEEFQRALLRKQLEMKMNSVGLETDSEPRQEADIEESATSPKDHELFQNT